MSLVLINSAALNNNENWKEQNKRNCLNEVIEATGRKKEQTVNYEIKYKNEGKNIMLHSDTP